MVAAPFALSLKRTSEMGQRFERRKSSCELLIGGGPSWRFVLPRHSDGLKVDRNLLHRG